MQTSRRIRRHSRPPERREIHAAERAAGNQAGHRGAEPQTTRTSIQGVLTLPAGADRVRRHARAFTESNTLLNKRMMDTVRAAAGAPDVVLFLVDATAAFSDEDLQAVDLVKKTEAPAIAVFNKMDWLHEKPKILDLIERYRALHDFAAYIPISAKTATAWMFCSRKSSSAFPTVPRNIPRII